MDVIDNIVIEEKKSMKHDEDYSQVVMKRSNKNKERPSENEERPNESKERSRT